MTARVAGALRAVWTDLVERRLWPVALALVALLVAVPVLLGGSGDDAAAPAPSPRAALPGTAAPGAVPAVKLEGAAVTGRNRPGAVRNPFFKPPRPETATPTTADVTPAGADSAPVDAPAPGGPTGTVAPAGPRVTPPAAPRRRAPGIIDERYTVSLRFGGPGAVEPIGGLERLSPLPSARDPFFVFVGVLRGGRVARFLVSSDVRATGDGTCRPRRSLCETIDMRAGDTQFFDFDLGPDGVRQYQLDVTAIRPATDPRPSAAAPRARTSGAPSRFDVLRADVRFGAAGAARTRRDVPRLTPFGAAGAPVAQFLGALGDRRTAIFMVAPGVTVAETERCLHGDDCRVLALGTGEGATLRSPAGEHRLDLLSLRRTIAPRTAVARRAHHREHRAGRRVMRALIADRHTAGALGRFSFSPRMGTIARR